MAITATEPVYRFLNNVTTTVGRWQIIPLPIILEEEAIAFVTDPLGRNPDRIFIARQIAKGERARLKNPNHLFGISGPQLLGVCYGELVPYVGNTKLKALSSEFLRMAPAGHPLELQVSLSRITDKVAVRRADFIFKVYSSIGGETFQVLKGTFATIVARPGFGIWPRPS